MSTKSSSLFSSNRWCLAFRRPAWVVMRSMHVARWFESQTKSPDPFFSNCLDPALRRISPTRNRLKPRHQHRIGMTLVELVVALVLASLMMAALLRITTLVASQQRQVSREQLDSFAAGLFAERLREDLVNARGIVVTANSITLAGFVSDQRVESRVQYETQSIAGRPVLLRRSENQTEVIWLDFGRFAFEQDEIIDGETPVPDGSGGLPPVPSSFRIAAWDQSGQVLFAEVVHHHGL